jgi:hypothetical protein
MLNEYTDFLRRGLLQLYFWKMRQHYYGKYLDVCDWIATDVGGGGNLAVFLTEMFIKFKLMSILKVILLGNHGMQ